MVLVSHDKLFVFLKTRETAGNEVELALERFCAPAGHVVQDYADTKISAHGIIGARFRASDPWRGIDGWRNYRDAASTHKALGDTVWADYLRVTTVRNPFDRMIAMFLFIQSNNTGVTPSVPQRIALFRGWIKRLNWPDDRDIVFDGEDYAITHALRFEHLADDMAALSDRLGLGLGPLPGPAPNPAKPTAAAYFDEDSTAIVRAQMAWVFDRYGYSTTPDS